MHCTETGRSTGTCIIETKENLKIKDKIKDIKNKTRSITESLRQLRVYYFIYCFYTLFRKNKESVIAFKYIYFTAVEILQVVLLNHFFQIAFGMYFPFFD